MAKKPQKRKRVSLKPDIPLPEKLATMNVTPRQLQNGNYQKKLQAFYAPHALPKMFNALMRNLDDNDPRSVQQAAEIYGILSGKRGDVNVVLNQTNQTANISSSDRRLKGAATTPDEIYRQLAEERQARKLLPASATTIEFIPTPVEDFTSDQKTEED